MLELSSYQLETTPSLRADIAMLLNITPDHLARHGGMEGYVAAKARILDAAGAEGLVVIGTGPHLDPLADARRKAGGKVSIINPADAPATIAGVASLAGPHNAENAAAAPHALPRSASRRTRSPRAWPVLPGCRTGCRPSLLMAAFPL
ncbi:MAG: hypothetical protein CM15mP115_18590 [Alphaproteobacteria bacterium]|nr:MAG: hypothetical protein CM15mP115_18590 [Alphaproteobacteria bacterium]